MLVVRSNPISRASCHTDGIIACVSWVPSLGFRRTKCGNYSSLLNLPFLLLSHCVRQALCSPRLSNKGTGKIRCKKSSFLFLLLALSAVICGYSDCDRLLLTLLVLCLCCCGVGLLLIFFSSRLRCVYVMFFLFGFMFFLCFSLFRKSRSWSPRMSQV